MKLLIQRLLVILFILSVSEIMLMNSGCTAVDEEVIPIDSLANPFFDAIVPFYLDEDDQGWSGGFAGYNSVLEDTLDLEFDFVGLPESFEKTGKALRWTGNNFQNNLFMFGWRKIPNLVPNQEYIITFDIGVGYQAHGNEFRLRDYENRLNIKVGAINYTPEIIKDEVLGRTTVNFDRGAQQTIDGDDMMWLGEMILGEFRYKDKILTNGEQRLFGVVSNDDGEIWILAGVESNVPIRHSVYLDSIVLYYRKVE